MTEQNSQLNEVVVFAEVDVLDDARKRAAATVLAKAGYDRAKAKAGKVRSGCVALAAKTAGVSCYTLNQWMNIDEEFLPAVERLKSHLKLQAWQNIERMGKKSLAANIYMLKCMEPETYNENVVALEWRYEIERRMDQERMSDFEGRYAVPVPVYEVSELPDPDSGERSNKYLEHLPEDFDDAGFTETSVNEKSRSKSAAAPDGSDTGHNN